MRRKTPQLDEMRADTSALRVADYDPRLQELSDGGFETRIPQDFAIANGLSQSDTPESVLWNRDGMLVLQYNTDDE